MERVVLSQFWQPSRPLLKASFWKSLEKAFLDQIHASLEMPGNGMKRQFLGQILTRNLFGALRATIKSKSFLPEMPGNGNFGPNPVQEPF